MPVLLLSKSYFSHKTEGFFLSPGAWTVVVALSGKRLRDPKTWHHNSYNVTLRRDNANCHVHRRAYEMSSDMRFPTNWYVRPAKTQISLRIHAVWSEPLLVAWIFYECYATEWTSFWASKLKRRLHRLVWVYTCQNATLLEITCHCSNYKIS